MVCKKKKLVFATWNILTLLDVSNNRPERRTALLSNELLKYNIDIAALSETRLSEEGSIVEKDYTFFWKGVNQGFPRIHGVGFAIKNRLVNVLEELPIGKSERIITLNITLSRSQKLTLVNIYAPTMTSENIVIEQFYYDLNSVLNSVPKSNKLILLGDFNARVGTDYNIWPGILGKNGVGKRFFEFVYNT